jgi:predicted nucleotidyltransferase
MRAREGDLVRTADNVIFDVKGLLHPPDKIIAFPRYIPNPSGTRGRPGEMYDKIYNLAMRFRFLQMVAPTLLVGDPVFGEKLCEIPKSAITKHYDPIKTLERLRRAKKLQPLEQKAVKLAEELKEASGIPWKSIGISGSVMAGLFTLQSDIDPLVYGSENCRKAYAALQKLLERKSNFKPYTKDELKALFEFRSKDTFMTFEDFEQVEKRKAFQGKYDGIEYFVRFVKDWNEIKEQYGDVCYEYAGYAKVAAKICDDSEALFTPCTYKIGDIKVLQGPNLGDIEEVTSFRGRFCEQAKPGETVLVQGKVERVTDKRVNRFYHRIIIGNQPADYMALSKL